jgi:hypothetical protein
MAKNLIIPLRRSTSALDVFLLLNVGNAQVKDQKGFQDTYPPNNMTKIRAAMNAIGPRVVRIHGAASDSEQPRYQVDINGNCTMKSDYLKNNIGRALEQLTSWRECYDTMREVENEGVEFDYLVRTRPDMLWYNPHPSFEKVTAPRPSLSRFWTSPTVSSSRPPLISSKNMNSDMYFGIPRFAAKAFFLGILDTYTRCKGNFRYPDPEHWVSGHLAKVAQDMRAEYRRVLTPFVIVLSSANSESARRKGKCGSTSYPGGVHACLRRAYPEAFANE